jgi:uncharacterized protein YqhQ
MSKLSIGGQAVMEGVMMRSQDRLSIAVREPSGKICVECRPWLGFSRFKWQKKPFLRGFFVLLETLVNGIKALNFSAQKAYEEEGAEIKPWALFLTVCLSVVLALGIFVVLPHLLSLGMKALHLGGDVNSLSFHLWDGLFKFVLFLAYIILISFLPDIKRVFQYHGAEHKVIHAYEQGAKLIPAEIKHFSRLHPRCGTAFLLFVLSISIIIFTFIVPLFLNFYTPDSTVFKHILILFLKFLLMIPISGIAYEIIKIAGKKNHEMWCKLFCLPGLFLQLLTTKEPSEDQLEVAIAALRAALGKDDLCSQN